jgi:hypothetical protein
VGALRSPVLSSRATPRIPRRRSTTRPGPHWVNGAYDDASRLSGPRPRSRHTGLTVRSIGSVPMRQILRKDRPRSWSVPRIDQLRLAWSPPEWVVSDLMQPNRGRYHRLMGSSVKRTLWIAQWTSHLGGFQSFDVADAMARLRQGDRSRSCGRATRDSRPDSAPRPACRQNRETRGMRPSLYRTVRLARPLQRVRALPSPYSCGPS